MNAINGLTYLKSAAITNTANSITGGDMTCPAGMVVAGGGTVANTTIVNQQEIHSSYPIVLGTSSVPNGWHVDMSNLTGSSQTFSVYAICVHATGIVTNVARDRASKR